MSELYGYAGKVLRVDLSSGEITHVPTMDYANRFLGGRGLAAKIYWDEVAPGVGAFDPENRVIFSVGPLAGFPALAATRWQVAGKSPTPSPEQFSYCNMGGYWGAQLKFAGYDGIIIQGKSSKPVYLFVDNDTVELRDASGLWGKGAVKTQEILEKELGGSTRIVSTGIAGDNLVRIASLTADHHSSGSMGFAAVLGSKKLKAIAVRGNTKPVAADPARLKDVSARIATLAKRMPQRMAAIQDPSRMKKDYCWGCIPERGCMREAYTGEDGTTGKFMCQSAIFYATRAERYYEKWTEVPFQANMLCDDYGMDTHGVEVMNYWLSRCLRAGILTDENTGIPISQMGGQEYIETLIRKMATRDGIGDTLAEGVQRSAEIIGQDSKDLITDYLHKSEQGSVYGAREYISTGLIYAFESRMPIQQLHHICQPTMLWVAWAQGNPNAYVSTDALLGIAEKFWGGRIAADFSTYEGKALAAKMVQDCQMAKDSLIVCDFSWPLQAVEFSDDHIGDPTMESQVYSAVTGDETDMEGLRRIGARIFNLQRAIQMREGRNGRQDDVLPDYEHDRPLKTGFGNPEFLFPGKDGVAFSRKGEVIPRDEWEKMKDEYYELRGWDVATGKQTRASMEALDLGDIADGLEKEGKLA